MTPLDPLIFDGEGTIAPRVVALLDREGASSSSQSDPRTFLDSLRNARSGLAVVVLSDSTDRPGPDLIREARNLGIPCLAIVPASSSLALVEGFDDWIVADSVDRELLPRLRKLAKARPAPPSPAIDPHFLALVVHDLRTPLNVIGLTIRAIRQTNPNPDPEFEEDLTFLHENARQMEKMLAQLADYCRLIESEANPQAAPPFEFDPRRFLADFIEDRQSRPGVEPNPVRLEIADRSPVEVTLAQQQARLALQHSVANAVAAAGDGPVRVRSSGVADRWIIEVVVDRPPPPTVVSAELRATVFERLSGVAAERKGLDLAIAARVSEALGGKARLEIEPGRRSTIVLDWPTRPPST